jgi:GNAT superfamily N-acetyltransferase
MNKRMMANKSTAARRAPTSERPIGIRPATAADEPILTTLANRLADFVLPEWRTADEIAIADGRAMLAAVHTPDAHSEVFIAERDGEAVGCLHILAETDFFGRLHAHISVIATTAAAQGTGVGQALLAYAEDWARHRRLALLTLNVFAGNDRARRVYERAGFSPEILKYAKAL